MARRQEQEPARSDVEEVAPGVLRMELPIRMPGLGHVNCYALLDANGAALVDPGLPSRSSFRALRRRLPPAGQRRQDHHAVPATHPHPDHFGGASRIAQEAGARILDRHSLQLGSGAPPAPEVSVEDLEAQASAPAEVAGGQNGREAFTPSLPSASAFVGRTPWRGPARAHASIGVWAAWRLLRLMHSGPLVPTISHPIHEGDVLELAGRPWSVKHTPGHTADHFCLHDPTERVFLAGDHVLPSITPHISGLSSRADPLAAFFESLERAAATPDVELVLPAHGHPFDDLAGRCKAIERHHQERLQKLCEIARELGPASVEDFSRRLFKRRSWGAMAESETYAHLEHLRFAGRAERHAEADGRLIYEL